MADSCKCGSGAINDGKRGRDPGVDLHLCDVCYWRKRAERAEAALKEAWKAAGMLEKMARQPVGNYGQET